MASSPPASHRLSFDPAFDARLRALLDAALPRILAHATPLHPRLLLLTGSAACGEACAVGANGGFLPLSDLDVALLTERSGSPDWRERLAEGLEEELAGPLRETGLQRNPLDVGLFPLPFFYRTPLTLEIAEAVASGVPLWGDPACLEPRRLERPSFFEALRLLDNRIHETLLPAGERSWLRLASPAAPVWKPGPGVTDWREAYRWAKLTLDAAKAWLAARGRHEASFRARLEIAGGMVSPAAREPGLEAWLPDGRAWSAWRVAPAWPPPAVSLAAITRLGREVVRDVARPAGIGDDTPLDRRAWRALLRLEGGAGRDRLRSWSRLTRRRPEGIGRGTALRLAARWAAHATPGALATLSLALAWLDAAGPEPSGEGLRDLMARELPTCRGLSAARWDESWERGLKEWLGWIEEAGA
jgi:hypothetical protein